MAGGYHKSILLLFNSGKEANRQGTPVILDPVGAGGTRLRRDAVKRLLDEVHFTVIRGNASEIRYLAGHQATGSGVDVSHLDEVSGDNLESSIIMAAELAEKLDTVIAISGKIDVISNGEESCVLRNGCATMARITGSGCMLTSLIGAYCGAYEDSFLAACSAMAVMGVSGEIALAIDADGVHVGQSDIKGRDIRSMIGENKILGISAGTVKEAIAAEKAGADYIGVGAVFGTSTKKNARNLTVEKLREIVNAVSIPVVAIGGINAKNVMELTGSGVDGVAVVSAIFVAEDPGKATAELLNLAKEMVTHG